MALQTETQEKEDFIRQILKSQDDFNSLNEETLRLQAKNATLRNENELYEEYIDNLMARINKISPEILSKFSKNLK